MGSCWLPKLLRSCLALLLGAAFPIAAQADGEPGWRVLETELTRLWIADPGRVHPVAVDSLDAVIRRGMDQLELSPAQRQQVKAQPIDYFLCAHPEQVERMSGASLEGLAMLQQNAVITRWLPHTHEIIHLLHARTLVSPEVMQEPVLMEGLACALGGRYRMGRHALAVRGEDLLDAGLINPSSLWSYHSFHVGAGDSDHTFPVAGRVVAFLLEHGGMPRFQELVWRLAGPAEIVVPRDRRATLRQVEAVYGRSWADLLVSFERWRRDNPPWAIEATVPPARKPEVRWAEGERTVWAWWEDDGSLIVRLAGGDGAVEALLLWGSPLPPSFQPWLLTVGTRGRRFGLRLGPAEAELIDFALDRVVAVARGSWRSRARDLYDDADNAVTVRIPAELMVGIPRPGAFELIAAPSFETRR